MHCHYCLGLVAPLLFATLACGCAPLEGELERPEVTEQGLSYSTGTTRTVTAKRVVYKDASGSYQATPGFEVFRAAGAPDADLFDIRISEVTLPSSRRAIVFMSAGQKVSSSSHENGLTGQSGGWDDACTNTTCPNVTLDGRSLAMKLLSTSIFPTNETYLALANDSNFQHLFDTTEKQQLVDGFVDWLTAQVRPETEAIYLAGSSRGGCLAMRMAQELRANAALDGLALYVSSFDGVCKYSQSELGTYGTKINNPVRPWGTFYGGWATNLLAQYPRRSGLYIYHVVGGAEVAAATGIRAFSAFAGSSPPKTGTNLNWGWYKQTWVKWAHKEIGNPYTEPSSSEQAAAVADTIDAQLTWLDALR